jgi:hypothetical protein
VKQEKVKIAQALVNTQQQVNLATLPAFTNNKKEY